MTRISTHVLDSGLGEPVCGMVVTLYRIVDGQRIELLERCTGNDGRIECMGAADDALMAGTYCLHFATGEYFNNSGSSVFYPYVEVVFNLDCKQPNYHIPLVFSLFGYSTYLGA
jgi:5-hydroxyisourate hydrolase